MKKFLSIIFIATLFVSGISAQNTGYNSGWINTNNLPRFAPTPYSPGNNTYSNLSWSYDSIPPSSITALGTGDTFYVTPTLYNTFVYSQIKDSIQLYVYDTLPGNRTFSQTGDILQCTFLNTNASVTFVHFAGPNWQANNSTTGCACAEIVIPANKEAIITFEYNGSTGLWVEKGRSNTY